VVGGWLFWSPWILGYAGLHAAMWNSLVAGFLVAVLGIWGVVTARRVATPLERVEAEPRSRI
jgi:hypothetical protein